MSVAALMVAAGAAQVNPAEADMLQAVEQTARARGVGLWSASAVSGAVRVIDGDTLDVAGTRVRMKGTSAPERKEPGGDAATNALKAMIGSGPVSCALTGETTHGRDVGYCFDARGVDLNRRMAAEGWALARPRYDMRYIRFEPLTGPARRAGYTRPAYCSAG